MKLYLIFVLLGLFINFGNSSYSDEPTPTIENSDVLTLTDKTFDGLPKGLYLVEFYAPWCGFCKKLSPIYEELATKFLKESPEISIRLAKVDCTVEKETCDRFDITSYPTLKMIDFNKKIFYEYKGDRSADDLTKYVKGGYLNSNSVRLPRDPNQSVEGSFKELSDSNFTDHISVEGTNWLVYFYIPTCRYCKQYGPKFESLAADFFEKGFNFAKIDCSQNPNICELYQITGYPTFKYIKNSRYYDFYQEPTFENLDFFIHYGAQLSPGRPLPWNLVFSLLEEAIKEFIWLFLFVSFLFGLAMGYIFFGMNPAPPKPIPSTPSPKNESKKTQ